MSLRSPFYWHKRLLHTKQAANVHFHFFPRPRRGEIRGNYEKLFRRSVGRRGNPQSFAFFFLSFFCEEAHANKWDNQRTKTRSEKSRRILISRFFFVFESRSGERESFAPDFPAELSYAARHEDREKELLVSFPLLRIQSAKEDRKEDFLHCRLRPSSSPNGQVALVAGWLLYSTL